MNCEELLDSAKDLLSGDRQDDYGDPAENHTRIGKLWEQALGIPVPPEKVALCMLLVKVSRLTRSPHHVDSWIDAAGYAALGGAIASPKEMPKPAVAPASGMEVDRLTKSEILWEWDYDNTLRFRFHDGRWELTALSNLRNEGLLDGWIEASDESLAYTQHKYVRVQ